MELISIVVPIYKVEQYLERCVDSILQQTYTNFQLILVDDGSPDRCGEICEKYARKDNRVTAIHKANGGLSDARNAGLKVAEGEYIAFVDSDDWIRANYLECLLENAKRYNCDICECEIVRMVGEECVSQNSKSVSANVYNTQEALGLLIQDKELHQYVWNKIYKRECIEGILFEVGKTNEDEFWTYQVFGKAKNVVKISDMLYFYFQREESIMNAGYNLKRLDALEGKCLRMEYLKMNFPELEELARINLITSCIYSGQMTLKYLQGDEKRKAKSIISTTYHSNRNNCRVENSMRGTERFWALLARYNFWGTCRLKNLLNKGY